MLQISFVAIFAILGHQLYFPQGIEATEKLEREHAVNMEALKEELAKVKSAGEEMITPLRAYHMTLVVRPLSIKRLFSLTRYGINTKDGTTIHDYNLKDVKEVLEHREEY